MIITCPECKARYNVKDSLVAEKGKNVRCKKCKTAFRTYPDGTYKRLKIKPKQQDQKPQKTEVSDKLSTQAMSTTGIVHSTVRVDASALQEAIKKQFEDPSAGHDKPLEPAPAKEEQPEDSGFSIGVEEPSNESGTENDPGGRLQGAFETHTGPTADSSSSQVEEDNMDPLSDTGNFGFDITSVNESSLDEKEEVPSLFEETEEVESPFTSNLDIPVQAVPEFQPLEPEIEVPDPDAEDDSSEDGVFDVSIDGTVYPNINLITLDRWIKEGRLLEKDQLSPSKQDQYAEAETYPEVKLIFQKYFQSSQSKVKEGTKKKKGFFARLFGR
ncbi:MAG: hypothetical protein CR997_10220 [Acidobacteria bacterium]|nr:MAG: hypothetical protein CR997_10220 [Acidobacteriota bacterium]